MIRGITHPWSARTAALFLLLVVFDPAARSVSLVLTPGSASAGGAVTLELDLAAADSSPAGIQWTLLFSPGDVQSVQVTANAVLSAASKSLYCSSRTGAVTCVAVGMNATGMVSGAAATVVVQLASAPGSATVPLLLTDLNGVLSDGTAVALAGSGASVSVAGWQPPAPLAPAPGVSSLQCSSATLVAGMSGTCVVRLGQPAVSSMPVSIATGGSAVSAPSAVLVPAGSISTIFGVTGSGVAVSQSVTLTASAAGQSRTALLTVEPPPFADVAPADYYYTAANLLYGTGITRGCAAAPLRYCPESPVARGQMATFLVRAMLGGDPVSTTATPYFADVPAGHPFFNWIQKLYELGITKGCAAEPLRFCPDDSVTRAQMAVFLIRGRYGATSAYAYPNDELFLDVPPSDVYFTFIQKMAQVGITSGCGVQLYCPEDVTTRGQMAVFIMRGLLNQLLAPATPVLTSATASLVQRGQNSVAIFLSGSNTHFGAGSTLSAGPGVTVLRLLAVTGETLVATVSVAGDAAAGPHSLTVNTPRSGGIEEAVLPNGLVVQ